MTYRLDVDVSDAVALSDAWDQAPEIAQEELLRVTVEAQSLLEREVRERTPRASGLTSESIGARQPRVLAEEVIGQVGSAEPHVIPVELGSKPHFPPIQPLADWAKLKFGVDEAEAESIAWGVARKIAARGTEGAFMFRRALDANAGQIEAIYQQAQARIARRMADLGGGA